MRCGTIRTMSDFILHEPVPSAIGKALASFEPYVQQLLYNRGITTAPEAARFLAPQYDTELHNPFLLNDMAAAVKRIQLAISENEKVVIYSDYDCDGIPGAVILHDFFTAIGFTNFYNYIPHRHYDGFGLSVKAVNEIVLEHQPSLIITIDCGTTDSEAVAQANKYGVDVVITDHHEPKETLPHAVAIVNPKVGTTYPFTGLCGAAVVFKLVQALIAEGNYTIASGQEKWWLDMVGIATIADMVPLTDENRVLAHFGLTVLRKSRRPGLQQLLRVQKAKQSHLTEDDIGFTIGPRINAASRMDTPEDAFWLLATTDEADAGARVAHLEKLNNERKGAVAVITKDIHKRLKARTEMPAVLVLGNPDWRPALVGLAANKLAEEHNRPVFLWGRDGNGVLKGSCRSGGSISVVRLMEGVSDVFLEFGGHHGSGGFSVREEAIHHLPEALLSAYETLGEAAVVKELPVADMELLLDAIDTTMLRQQRQCAPFGLGNPKPLYVFRNIVPTTVAYFGKAKEHTKLMFSTTGLAKEAIAFFKLPEQFSVTPQVGQPITLLAHLEESFFMGRMQTRLRIVDIL
jgi:single-stranded-DNA-specific exonuclease